MKPFYFILGSAILGATISLCAANAQDPFLAFTIFLCVIWTIWLKIDVT